MVRPVVSSGRLKRRRRNRRLLIIGGAVFAFALVFAGLVWLSYAPFLRVVNVEVSGAASVPAAGVESYARGQMQGAWGWLFARNNIFLYPRVAIASGLLRQYPILRSVDVHAKDFNSIEITVAERQGVALWCPQSGSESCRYLDETGLAYAPAVSLSDSPFITYQGALATTTQQGLEQYLTPEEFQSLSALVVALGAKEPGDPIGQVAVDSAGDVRVYFHDAFVLIFSSKDDGGDIFERFALALQSDTFAGKTLLDFEYLDLRFGDKLYYKLKNQ